MSQETIPERNRPHRGNARPAPLRRGTDGPTHARLVALRVLDRVDRAGAYADLALHAELDRGRLAARERAFATELLYGTLRWRGRLDFLLAQVLERDLEKVEARVANVLRLGAYQLLFCGSVPDAAAVSESVRLARAAGLERATGLVNAALRRLAAEGRSLPLPDLERDPVGHLTHALSMPRWIAERWVERLGPSEAAALARACNTRPPRCVRVNAARGDRELLLEMLRPRYPQLRSCRYARDGLVLGSVGPPPAHDPAFLEGLFTIQDEASQCVVDLLDPRPGERVLDACAAPGTKTTAIAERVGATGQVVALDRHERRLALLSRDTRRLGLENVQTLQADASHPLQAALGATSFDRILVDAPCSGLGALRRNPDARWRARPDAGPRLASLQRAILRGVAPLLRPGGTLVYSTCTVEPEENDAVVDSLLAETPAFARVPRPALPAALGPALDPRGALCTQPHRHDCDGFYAVRLERSS